MIGMFDRRHSDRGRVTSPNPRKSIAAQRESAFDTAMRVPERGGRERERKRGEREIEGEKCRK